MGWSVSASQVIKLRAMVNIYLVGFMGAGKTSVGQRLARHLGARFLDLDHELSEDFDCSISEVFENSGEAVFRAAEADMLRKLSAKEGLVVATGGGAFSTDGNRRIIEESGGISVFLELPWDVLQRRLECDNKDRPVYQSAGQARNLLEERLPHYRRATLSFALNGDETPDEIVETVADAVQGMPCGT